MIMFIIMIGDSSYAAWKDGWMFGDEMIACAHVLGGEVMISERRMLLLCRLF